jgi:hypothetical protein
MSDDITGFRIDIPDADLDDLRQRLRQTRWPEPETVDDWSQGIPLAYVRQAATSPRSSSRRHTSARSAPASGRSGDVARDPAGHPFCRYFDHGLD